MGLRSLTSDFPCAQYWKSNANYWCELCKVWMTDKQSTRATHEAGIKHQELLQKSAPAPECLHPLTPRSPACVRTRRLCIPRQRQSPNVPTATTSG